ncbi:hypothetical protein J4421_00195 [Candidatus Woesearchaeota archaeon]|nr:hypothetical protein [Candidatus Woesearchaeota archaeon]
MTDIFRSIERARKIAQRQVPRIQLTVDNLISNEEIDPTVIERQLDEILNYAPFGIAVREFQRLNAYYRTIDRDAAQDYDKTLRILRGEEG